MPAGSLLLSRQRVTTAPAQSAATDPAGRSNLPGHKYRPTAAVFSAPPAFDAKHPLTNGARCDILSKHSRCAEYRGVEQLEARRAHNPEVVGSSPASATIKTPDFTTKSGVFLTFWHKMVSVKMGLELVLELVAETLKTQNRENLTFLDFYFS